MYFLPLLGYSKSDENVCFSFSSTRGDFYNIFFFGKLQQQQQKSEATEKHSSFNNI
jgi:hypothetical protein